MDKLEVVVIGQDHAQVLELLKLEGLPTEDLRNDKLKIFATSDGDEVIGCIGIERYEQSALLRSLVVSPKHRNLSVASRLVSYLEQWARDMSIIDLYLLTTTADAYFVKRGFSQIAREEVPRALMVSGQFQGLCPQSVIIMRKSL